MKKTISVICVLILLLCGCSTAKPPQDDAADAPDEPQVEYRTLVIDENKALYSYNDMETDLETMSLAYKDITHLDIIGSTPDGRNIYDMVIGDYNAPEHVIIHASIHAREYMTTKLVMKQLAYYLNALNSNTGEYNGIPYSELFGNVALHIIPMVNPDGVSISQYGLSGLNNDEVRDSVNRIAESAGFTDFSQWKANANGVDLNRNYDALWDEYSGSAHPSPERYKGEYPGSEPETKALIDVTTKYPVVRTISYHTFGQVVYWYFGQSGDLYNKSAEFAQSLSDITGYALDSDYQNLDPAGYKDWAISKLGIPGVTIEVGYGSNPVPDVQFDGIWERNKDVWAGCLYNIKY